MGYRGDIFRLQDARLQSGGQPDRENRPARPTRSGLEPRPLLGRLHRNVARHGKQDARRKKAAPAQRKNVARSLISWFKRGLRRLQFCLQRLIPPPPLWAAWKNDGW